MPESTDTDYTHLDMTPEYNRIITALTGIRDDVRLLQKLQSDPESGIATSNPQITEHIPSDTATTAKTAESSPRSSPSPPSPPNAKPASPTK